MAREGAWTVQSEVQPGMKLFCFPHAGGDSSVYRSWVKPLAPLVEVMQVDYPGHGRRFGEEPSEQLDDLVRGLTVELAPRMRGDFALFGHSMGALVVFELARALRREQATLPRHLFVAGAPDPRTPQGPYGGREVTDEDAVTYLREMGNTPPEVFEHAELLELIIPALRADLLACDRYQFRPEPPLPFGATALGGTEDVDTPPEELERWRDHFTGPFRSERIAGGHFFLSEVVADLVKKELSRLG